MASPAISIKIDGDKELMAEFNRMSKGVGKKSLTYATIQVRMSSNERQV